MQILNDHILVSLTTSKFSPFPIDGHIKDHNIFVGLNIPICVAEAKILITGKDIEMIEHTNSLATQQMAREVFVDVQKRYVFIGENRQDESSSLVIYKENSNNQYTREFFKRWSETQSLLFEFQVFNNSDPCYVLKGYWEKNKWTSLKINPTPKLIIE